MGWSSLWRHRLRASVSRFREPQDPDFVRMNTSIGFDRRLWPQDIAQSKAHAAMLAARGILSEEDRDVLLRGLDGLQIAGADIVEVSPAYDHAEITALAAAQLAYELLALLARG